ncbi:MAG: PAS domain S-box protein, partial [Methanoregula sp.]|nr:PAS domain S-box protein [Methanoregula sp.]
MAETIRVLYVDDEHALLDLGKLFLERTGEFSVTTIDSASAALTLLRTEQFDVIISDYQMPEMNGLEFLKEVRLHQGQIPFILFTGRGREEVVILALNNGADFYLQKGGNPQAQFAELSHKTRAAVQRRITEKAFRESEEKFRVLADTSPVGIAVLQGNRDVYINDYAAQMSGYSKEELCTMNFWDMIHPDFQEMIKERGLARQRGEAVPTKYEVKYLTRTKEVRWAYLSSGSIIYGGKPAVVVMLVDITERKAAEDELQASYEHLSAAEEELREQYDTLKENQQQIQKSEQDYRSILENIQDVYYRTDTQGNLILASPSLATLLGYSSVSELYGKSIAQTLYYTPEDREKILADILKNGSVTNFEVTFKKQDGTPVIISTSSHEYFDADGNSLGVEGIFRNITERKQSEESLKKSENLYRTIFEMTGAATIIIEKDTTISLANSGFAKISGFSIDELEGKKSWTEFIVKEDLERMKKYHSDRRNDSSLAPRVYEFRFITRSGEIRYCINNVGVIPGTTRSVASVVDITKRVEVEQTLRESENLYRTIFNNTGAATIIIAPDTTILLANEGWVNLTGIPREEQENKKSWTDFVDKDDLERMRQYHYQRRNDPTLPPKVYEFKMVDVKNTVHHCFVHVDIIPGSQNSVASLVDITARVQAEELYQTVFENTGTAMAILEEDTTISHINEEMGRVWGYAKEEIERRVKWPQLVTKEDLPKLMEYHRLRRVDPDFMQTPYEFGFVHKTGEIRQASVAVAMIPGTKKSVISIRDITKAKQNEKALRESEEKFRALVDQSLDGIIITDFLGNLLFANRKAGEIIGHHEVVDLVGTVNVLEFIIPEFRVNAIKDFSRVAAGIDSYLVNYKLLTLEKKEIWIECIGKKITFGGSFAVLLSIRDISHRKVMEVALKESEAKYRTIIENIQDLIYQTDLQGNLTMVSPAGIRLAGYKSPEDVIGKNIARDLYADPKQREELLAVLREKGEVHDFPVTLNAGDGTTRYATASSHFYYDSEGMMLGVEGILHDVTERKRAEDALLQANHKLNLLYGITRHDINNQLSVLMGYLALLEEKVAPAAPNEYFLKAKTAAGQISSMIRFTKEYEEIGVTKPVWHDVRTLADGAAKIVSLGQVHLKNNLPAGMEVFADPLIAKVFFNLMDNAVR